MPNPLGWFAHHAPPDFHKMEVAITFFEQLVLPFLMLLPIRSVRIFSGLAEIVFQLAVVGTGNYAWINFVGVLPCLVLFDDAFLAPFFGKQMASEARVAATAAAEDDRSVLQQRPATSSSAVPDSLTYSLLLRPLRRGYQYVRYAMYLGLVCFIAKKSVSPLKELFTPAPWLHFYDEYFFVNSQGVFGFINQQRNVLVLEYTHDDVGEAHISGVKCKDSEKTPFTGGEGGSMSCAGLAVACQHPEHGPLVRQTCPRTCQVCVDPVRWRAVR